MATLSLTKKVSGGGATVEKVTTHSADTLVSTSFTVATGQTDLLHAIDFSVASSKLKGIYINSTQAVLMEFNSTAGSGGSINLTADNPYVWDSASYFTNLITADVTAVYVTNASGSTATINMEVVYDPT